MSTTELTRDGDGCYVGLAFKVRTVYKGQLANAANKSISIGLCESSLGTFVSNCLHGMQVNDSNYYLLFLHNTSVPSKKSRGKVVHYRLSNTPSLATKKNIKEATDFSKPKYSEYQYFLFAIIYFNLYTIHYFGLHFYFY